MAEAKEDRRVQRTRLTLRSAMVSLIRERGFETLTVQDIIDRADVGRSTFYSHFRSKEDLLEGSVAMLRASLKKFQLRAQAATATSEERLFVFSHELIAHAHDHRDVFAAMIGKRSGTLFETQLRRMIADLVRDDLESVLPRRGRDRMRLEVTTQFIAGGLLGLLVTWLNEMPEVTVDDLDARFRRMALPAVQAALA
jgi:AcrR family transcriptional regulator